jgi:hypothetical protein
VREPVIIPNDGVPGATWYLAWVAYPGANDASRRQKWVDAVAGLSFKDAKEHPPPALQGRKKGRLNGIYKDGVNLLHHRRRTAIHIFLRRFAPEDRGGLTAMEAYLEVARHAPAGFGFGAGGKSRTNDEYTVGSYFRQSTPTLAMAYPVFWLTAQWEPGRERRSPCLTWDDLVGLTHWGAQLSWVNWAVAYANGVAPVIVDTMQAERYFSRLLVPEMPGGAVPQLKAGASLPQSATAIALLVDSKRQLPGPKR